MPAGYSATPLIKKLGISQGARVAVFDKPIDYESLLGALPQGVNLGAKIDKATTLVHVFATERKALQDRLKSLRANLAEAVPVWVSWPKKSSKAPTDITEDTIREVALPLGYVDVKVCAVSEVWSGLKLVVRKELRSSAA
jgi:hypothetical protein